MRTRLIACCVLALVAPALARAAKRQAAPAKKAAKQRAAKPKFELKDGDRVVFLGNTLIERAQKYGYWETMLTARYPNRKIIFRNLGWDGDTVWAESRGLFDSPQKGYARMLARVGTIKPTVIFLGYGNNEAFAGKPGLPRFVKQYNKLLDDLTRVSAKGVRFVLLSPTLHEDLREMARIKALFDKPAAEALKRAFKKRLDPNKKDPGSQSRTQRYNANAELYSNAIRRISKQRHAQFVDFAKEMRLVGLNGWTSNGLHFSRAVYANFGVLLENALEQDTPDVCMTIHYNPKGKLRVDGDGAKIAYFAKDGRIRFKATCPTLPTPGEMQRNCSAQGLKAALYSLKIDGVAVATAHSGQDLDRSLWCFTWRVGVDIEDGPEFDQREKLRQAIIEKNRLYFHSWRPQNITYLFLFRKHEQGQNAKEVQQFLKLVAEKEKEIDRLKKPVTRTYELIRVKPKEKASRKGAKAPRKGK